MIIQLDRKFGIDLSTIRVGDIVSFENGSCYLFVQDFDGQDYRAVDLTNNITTDYDTSISNIIHRYIKSTPVEIFRADEIVLGRI
ncbi:hypothetical protein P5F55_13850 [Clostridium perfringens]|uniref:hypothetical protein n=1 Tax=Clostridium perfringens TaxID=1502 RepID=UPI00297637BC|nr:hypothetical protein [Clostridium perfringens]MDK0928445.1 hypothetical protein [Clostridium perfringens]MDM0495329.1 hypothetical protein [Clostridium perfringens]MDM0781045.1 hypothetical protein [Clostridium perfringens]